MLSPFSVNSDCSSNTHKSLQLFFPNISPGGTERVIQTLLPELDRQYSVDCLVLKQASNSPFESLDNIKITALKGIARGGIRKYVQWVRQFKLHNQRRSPDVILSFGEVPIVISAIARFLGILTRSSRLILCVRNHESTFLEQARLGYLKKKIFGWALAQGDLITCNSYAIAKDIKTVFRCNLPVKVIYNPVDLHYFGNDKIKSNCTVKDDSCHIVNIARLDRQKGQRHLLRAFSKVQKIFPGARLTVIGEGPEKKNLLSLADKLCLRNVVFKGWVSDIALFLSEVDVFCLSSLWEGMPNVLLEAMAAGVPVVAFDCNSGPKEILADGRYGKLAPVGNEQALAEALLELCDDQELRSELSRLGHERSREFGVPKIIQHWVEIIEKG